MKIALNGEKERTQDIRVSQNITFESLLLSSQTLSGFKSAGFYRPSPIQLQGIPLGKCGFDLLLEAKSGTGKTAVFTIIALEKLDLEKGLQAIILAPTREIAVQICDVIQQLGAGHKGLKTISVIGGMPVQEDIMKIKNENIHIVVASPGRLRHLIQDKHLNTSAVRLLVLDEADKLMEKSFINDVNYIFSVLPKQKQIIMSSATYPETTKAFIEKYVQNAQHVCPENNSVLLGVKQTICTVKHNHNVVKQTQYRFEELIKILSQKQFKQCLIFCNYQTRVVELKKKLNKEKWPAEHLFGQQEQCDRLDALKMLQEYKCRILISTDLAARGIDASNVDLVINFEPPLEWQTYLHRIGRAGRFGSYGIAVTIVSEGKEQKNFQQILDLLQVPTHYFWQENKDTDTNVSPILTKQQESSVNHDKNHNFKLLWECLATETCTIEGNIESFEDVCKSFNTLRIQEKIESFTGLMNSFQAHQSELNKAEVKLKVKSPDLNSVKLKIQTIKELINLNNKNEGNSYTTLETQTEANLETEEIENLKTEESVNLRADEIINHEYQEELKGCKKIKEYNNTTSYLTEDMTSSLELAGLPTSFGKQTKKFKNLTAEKKDKKWDPKRNQTNNEHVKEQEVPKQLQKRFTKYKNTTRTCSTNSSSSDSGFKNSTLYLHTSYFDTISKHTIDTQMQHNYIHWYNELKQRVRQIEYAVYIKEMSTL